MATDIFEEIVISQDGESSEEMDIFDYAKRIIACQMEIKAINDDIKIIKTEAKERGTLVKEIDSAIATLKKEAKQNPQEAQLQEEVLEKLRSNKEIVDSISMII